MYCANYDYHGIYEPIQFVHSSLHSPLECVICLESQNIIIENDISFIELPIQLQTTYYVKMCKCNIWIHTSCLDTWYNLHHTCPICNLQMYKYYKYLDIIKTVIMCNTCIVFGTIYSIISILKMIRLLLFILFWYNVFFIVRLILILPFTYGYL